MSASIPVIPNQAEPSSLYNFIPPRRRRPRRGTYLFSLGMVAALGVTGLFGGLLMGSNDRNDTLQASQHRTSIELTASKASLAKSQASLSDSEASVTDLRGQLSASEVTSRGLGESLTTAQTRITAMNAGKQELLQCIVLYLNSGMSAVNGNYELGIVQIKEGKTHCAAGIAMFDDPSDPSGADPTT